MSDFDVIVVGAGNAALAASVSAVEHGAQAVLVLEKAPRDMRGGNTHWSGGLLRIAYDDVTDLEPLVPEADETLPGERYVADESGPPIGAAESDHAILLVGPEGGLTDEEIALAESQGFERRSLGVTTLRAEMAVVAGAVLLLQPR